MYYSIKEFINLFRTINKENKDIIGRNINNKILINNDKKDVIMELYCKLYNKGLLSNIEKYSDDNIVKFVAINKKFPKRLEKLDSSLAWNKI